MVLRANLRNLLPGVHYVMSSFGRARQMSSIAESFPPPPTCLKAENSCKKPNYGNKYKLPGVPQIRCLNPLSSEKEITRIKKHSNPFHDLLDERACCPPCYRVDRLDDLYYRISDKRARVYRQTWISCRPPILKPKRACIYDDEELPPIERRIRCKPPMGVCMATKIAQCKIKSNVNCPRIKLPGCRPAKVSSFCRNLRRPTECIKVCAPYPAYSECNKIPANKKVFSECGCLDGTSFCDAIMYARRYKKMGL